MATLFGLVILTHQVGGFLGAWLGGKVFEATGNDDVVWIIDIACGGRGAGASADSRGQAGARCGLIAGRTSPGCSVRTARHS